MIAIILAWVGLVFASVFLVGTKEPEELAFLVRMIFICVSGNVT